METESYIAIQQLVRQAVEQHFFDRWMLVREIPAKRNRSSRNREVCGGETWLAYQNSVVVVRVFEASVDTFHDIRVHRTNSNRLPIPAKL